MHTSMRKFVEGRILRGSEEEFVEVLLHLRLRDFFLLTSVKGSQQSMLILKSKLIQMNCTLTKICEYFYCIQGTSLKQFRFL